MPLKPAFPLSKIVEVIWYDSCTSGGWKSIEDMTDTRPLICCTVGYLLKRDRHIIQIIQSQTEYHKLSDSMTIPRACVLSYRVLRKGRRQ